MNKTKTIIEFQIKNPSQPTIPEKNRIVIFDNPSGTRIALDEALDKDLLGKEIWNTGGHRYSTSAPSVLALILEALAFGTRKETEENGVRTIDLGLIGTFDGV